MIKRSSKYYRQDEPSKVKARKSITTRKGKQKQGKVKEMGESGDWVCNEKKKKLHMFYEINFHACCCGPVAVRKLVMRLWHDY